MGEFVRAVVIRTFSPLVALRCFRTMTDCILPGMFDIQQLRINPGLPDRSGRSTTFPWHPSPDSTNDQWKEQLSELRHTWSSKPSLFHYYILWKLSLEVQQVSQNTDVVYLRVCVLDCTLSSIYISFKKTKINLIHFSWISDNSPPSQI